MKIPYSIRRGVGLVELLMSMAMFTLLSSLSAAVMVQQGMTMAQATDISQATEIGTSLLEDATIVAMADFDDPFIEDDGTVKPYPLGNFEPLPDRQFSATYTVEDRRWDGAAIDGANPADHKIVEVTVTWQDFSGVNKTRVFRTVIGP